MLLIISSILFGVSIIVLGTLIYRRLPELSSVDVRKGITEDSNSKVKSSILEERLKRKLGMKIVGNTQVVITISKAISKYARKWYCILIEAERKYASASEKMEFNKKKEYEQKEVIDDKLENVTLQHDGKEQEAKYLEILSLDPKNMEAYEGLGKLYVKQKDHTHAKEIYEFLTKTKNIKTEYFIDLSECYIELDDKSAAIEALVSAHEREPRNPKIIDRLVDLAIMIQDKKRAVYYLTALKEVNKENKNIKTYKEAIKQIKT